VNRPQAVTFIYGLINIAMGIHGYVGAGSKASIIAGCAVGILCIFFAALSKTHARIGYIGAAIVGLLTALQWIPHLFNKDTHDLVIYPALVGLVISAVFVIYLLGAHFMAKAKSAKAAAAVGHDDQKGKSN
jgi:uncharacterized membrane protein (UPF0136 family)